MTSGQWLVRFTIGMATQIEVSCDGVNWMKLEDADATWDGKGSLDEHRQKAFADLKQAGFGAKSDKSKARRAAAKDVPKPPEGEMSDG